MILESTARGGVVAETCLRPLRVRICGRQQRQSTVAAQRSEARTWTKAPLLDSGPDDRNPIAGSYSTDDGGRVTACQGWRNLECGCREGVSQRDRLQAARVDREDVG